MWGLVNSDNFEGDQYQDALQHEMDSWLQDAIGASGLSRLPQIVQDILIERFKNIIVGENGILERQDFDDENKLRQQLYQSAVDIYSKTYNKSSLSEVMSTGVITPKDVVTAIYDRVLGNRDAVMTEVLGTLSESLSNKIIETYNLLSLFGFSDSDIGSFRGKRGSLFSDSGASDLSALFSSFDEEQVKSAQVLIQQLGWTISDFYSILSDPDKANTFTEFLKNTDNELTTLTANTSFEDLKTAYLLLAYVSNKTKNGEDLNVSDLTNLSRYTPWLLNQVGTETFLSSAMQSMDNVAMLMDGYYTELAQQAYASLDKKPSGGKADWIKTKTLEIKRDELTELEDLAAEMFELSKIDALSESSALDEHMTYMPAENVQATNDALAEAQAQIGGVQAQMDAAAKSAKNLDTEYNKLQADLGKTPEVNEGLDATYESFEKVYSELKNYERGSAEYWARLNELMQGGTQEILDATNAFTQLNQEVEEGIPSAGIGRPDLSIGKGLLAFAGASDVNYGSSQTASKEEQLPLRFSNADAEGMQAYIEAAITLTQYAIQLNQSIEASQANAGNYFAEVNSLAEAFARGGIYEALVTWQYLDSAVKNSIASTYPNLIKVMGEVAFAYDDEENAAKALGKELDSAVFKASSRYFTNTAKAIDALRTNTMLAVDSYAAFYKEAERAVAAQSEYLTATDKMADGQKLAAEDVSNLAAFLGFITPDNLLQSWDQVGPMLASSINEGTEALQRLNEAAFIQITGTSVADFSALTSGLLSVINLSEQAVEALIQTGQWKLETISLPQQGAQWDPISGTFKTV